MEQIHPARPLSGLQNHAANHEGISAAGSERTCGRGPGLLRGQVCAVANHPAPGSGGGLKPSDSRRRLAAVRVAARGVGHKNVAVTRPEMVADAGPARPCGTGIAVRRISRAERTSLRHASPANLQLYGIDSSEPGLPTSHRYRSRTSRRYHPLKSSSPSRNRSNMMRVAVRSWCAA